MKWYEKVDMLDRRVIYVLLVFAILIPLIKPIGLPILVSREVKTSYDAVEALKPGQYVILSPSYSPGTDAEMLPQHLAMTKHLMAKKARMIVVHLVVDGIMYSEKVFDQLAKANGYEYGRDYVLLPYKAGEETAVAALGRDLKGFYKEDYYNKATADMPIWKDLTGIKDVQLIVDYMPGNSLLWYIKQINATYGVAVTGGCTAVCIPGMMPYVASGQMKGLLGGLGGAAEYEQLLKQPARASAGMDAQSLAHLLVLFFMVLGNASTIARRNDQKAAGKGR